MIWETFIGSCKRDEDVRESVAKYETIKSKPVRSKREKSSQEVEAFQAYLDVIKSFHRSTSGMTWQHLDQLECPVKPEKKNYYEQKIRRELENYQPNLYEKLFKKDKKKVNQFVERIPCEIEKDNQRYYKAVDQYSDYLEQYETLKACYDGIKEANGQAYIHWLNKSNAFEELNQYGIKVTYDYNDATLNVSIDYSHSKLIPMYSKKLIDDQVIAVVITEQGRQEHLKDVIYSCCVRAAREVFELLPVNKTIVKNYTKAVDPALAVVFKRELFERLDLQESSAKYIVETFNYKMNTDAI